MADCLFCKLVVGNIPSYTIYEDSSTQAFLDIFPSSSGHTIVICKKHGETILDYAPQDLQNLMESTQEIVKALSKTLRTNVYTIGINHGEPAGVHHLHIHIIPRFPTDNGGVIQSIVTNKSEEDLAGMQEKISGNMPKK